MYQNLVSPSGEKSFITQRGADEAIPPEIITEELMAKAKWLHISGYALYSEMSRPAAEKAIRLALAGGVPVSMDPSSWYPLEEYGVSRFLNHVRKSALLLPNYEEGWFRREKVSGRDGSGASGLCFLCCSETRTGRLRYC